MSNKLLKLSVVLVFAVAVTMFAGCGKQEASESQESTEVQESTESQKGANIPDKAKEDSKENKAKADTDSKENKAKADDDSQEQLDVTKLSFWVVFFDEEGNELQRTVEKYGTTPVFAGETPIGFAGWDQELEPIITNTYIYAVCEDIPEESSEVEESSEAEKSDDENPEKPTDPGTVTNRTLILERANEALGRPYAWGFAGPDSFDCSGLVSYCIAGVPNQMFLPLTIPNLLEETNNPQPGDICCNSDHCGIYVGGGSMIHAPGEGYVVAFGAVQGGMKYYIAPTI